MNQKSFHSIIFKSTGLFGISQLIKIIVRVVTNKVAALFLGPTGIGIIGLLENILALILGFTNFGIASSSVREIALVSDDADTENLKEQRLLKIIYKWALGTGILGLLVTVIFAKAISQEVFNTTSNYYLVLFLSLYFIFTSISTIRLAVLQAKKRISTIVKYNIITAVFSSIIAVLGYYTMGIEAIIPVLVFTSFIGFLTSLYFTRHIRILQEPIFIKQVFNEGLPMVKLGLLLSVSVIFGQICFYIIRWFLKENYSFETLGFYQVSNTILIGYLGLVFTAMATDFYPRLCNYENEIKQFNKLINDQTEVALLLVVPAIILLYLIAPYLIVFLYSEDFLQVLPILKIGLFAIILKAIVWPTGFITLVKGNKLLYLKQSLLGDGVNVFASIILFYYFGLIGLGIAMVTMFLVSGIYNYYIAVKYYNFEYRKETLQIILFSLLIGVIVCISVMFLGFSVFNPITILCLLLSVIYSVKKLKEKLKF